MRCQLFRCELLVSWRVQPAISTSANKNQPPTLANKNIPQQQNTHALKRKNNIQNVNKFKKNKTNSIIRLHDLSKIAKQLRARNPVAVMFQDLEWKEEVKKKKTSRAFQQHFVWFSSGCGGTHSEGNCLMDNNPPRPPPKKIQGIKATSPQCYKRKPEKESLHLQSGTKFVPQKHQKQTFLG